RSRVSAVEKTTLMTLIKRLTAASLLTAITACNPAAAPSPAAEHDDFDRAAALSAFNAAAERVKGTCSRADGPHGTFRITVRLAPQGRAQTADIEASSARVLSDAADVRACVEREFREIRVPPFHGTPIIVTKTFWLT